MLHHGHLLRPAVRRVVTQQLFSQFQQLPGSTFAVVRAYRCSFAPGSMVTCSCVALLASVQQLQHRTSQSSSSYSKWCCRVVERAISAFFQHTSCLVLSCDLIDDIVGGGGSGDSAVMDCVLGFYGVYWVHHLNGTTGDAQLSLHSCPMHIIFSLYIACTFYGKLHIPWVLRFC
jgi:hypothetical protein